MCCHFLYLQEEWRYKICITPWWHASVYVQAAGSDTAWHTLQNLVPAWWPPGAGTPGITGPKDRQKYMCLYISKDEHDVLKWQLSACAEKRIVSVYYGELIHFSLPKHKVLKVSNFDRSLSIVVRHSSSFLLKHLYPQIAFWNLTKCHKNVL